MNGPKKEISVDDILNEYAQMAGSQTPPQKPHTTIEPGGDQIMDRSRIEHSRSRRTEKQDRPAARHAVVRWAVCEPEKGTVCRLAWSKECRTVR